MTAFARSFENSVSRHRSTSFASDMMAGDGVEMFTCSVLHAGTSMAEGSQTEMFTCSVLTIGTDTIEGDETGLFTCSV
ncbi:MAG: hypothetical protein WA782_02190 [Sulfitobacter sp.]